RTHDNADKGGGSRVACRPGRPPLNAPRWRLECSDERSGGSPRDSELNTEVSQQLADRRRIRMLGPQLNQLRSTGGMLGGVWTPAPVNQEGYQPVSVPHVRVGESPGEHLPVALLALAASHLAQVLPGGAARVRSAL